MARRLLPRLSQQRSAAGIERRGGDGLRRQNLSRRSRKLEETGRGSEMTSAKQACSMNFACIGKAFFYCAPASGVESFIIGQPGDGGQRARGRQAKRHPFAGSHHILAAIHGKRRAGDETRFFGDEKDDTARNFLW